MSQENVEHEPEALEELVWIWGASLVLMRREAYPHERWLLLQGGSPVAAIEETDTGWSLTTTSQRCSAAIRRRRRRVGWHVEVLPSGERTPLVEYHPATLRAGGTLTVASGGRYKLRRPAGSGSEDWTLASPDGDRLARFSLRTKPPSGSALARDRTGLTPAAASEPDLKLLIVSACVALILHKRMGVMGAGLGG